ncbi:DUF4856 domain-containing protein [Flexithrix dorotheae]|uniref:DUF4856 domain-containing protein n=1 Tax=Flexithrix dorotheae TaxID=70993 RepID=UPI00037EAA55|nr:DUF4856 domain-containing protein [Flexithrix dorotheae]
MKKILVLALISGMLYSCSEDENLSPSVNAPETYTFERNSSSTVAFNGQTNRIMMAKELVGGMLDFAMTKEQLLEMYRNETASGGDAAPFENSDLNSATQSIKSKVAASSDYFSTNTTESSEVKADFESWINAQIDEVFPNQNKVAAPGIAGQIADGSSTRYVNKLGLEYNQAVAKSLIGALMADQMLNNYLSSSVLDANNNQQENDDKITVDGKSYTYMEHYWDEAYGYLYGTATDKENPNPTVGSDDDFLNKYLGRVDGDEDFSGIADDLFNALKLGRAAIVENGYSLRDEQVKIIREKVSQVIAVRAVYYLQQGKAALPDDRNNEAAYGSTFHALSEGYGFIYSLRFTRMPDSDQPYFTKSEVDTMLSKLMGDGANGLWDIEESTLDSISEEIAAKFDFTVAEAGS